MHLHISGDIVGEQEGFSDYAGELSQLQMYCTDLRAASSAAISTMLSAMGNSCIYSTAESGLRAPAHLALNVFNHL